MEYFVKSGNPEKQRVGCVIVGIFDRRKPTDAAAVLDRVSGGAIATALRRGDMDGKVGQSLILHGLTGMFCDRVLLVGLCLLYTSPSPRDRTRSRMPSSA